MQIIFEKTVLFIALKYHTTFWLIAFKLFFLVFFLFQLGHSDLSQSQSTWVNFLTMVIIISFWSQSNLKQFEAVAQ